KVPRTFAIRISFGTLGRLRPRSQEETASRPRPRTPARFRWVRPALRRYSRMWLGNRGAWRDGRGVCWMGMASLYSDPKKNRRGADAQNSGQPVDINR